MIYILIAYANILIFCSTFAGAAVNTFTYINAYIHQQTRYSLYIYTCIIYVYTYVYIDKCQILKSQILIKFASHVIEKVMSVK